MDAQDWPLRVLVTDIGDEVEPARSRIRKGDRVTEESREQAFEYFAQREAERGAPLIASTSVTSRRTSRVRSTFRKSSTRKAGRPNPDSSPCETNTRPPRDSGRMCIRP
jgi:hypothetical protein